MKMPSAGYRGAARGRGGAGDEGQTRQKVRKGSQPGATPASLPELQKGDARDQVGKVVGVSGRSPDKVRRVRRGGSTRFGRPAGTAARDGRGRRGAGGSRNCTRGRP